MSDPKLSMAEQVAHMASELQFRRTGHAPRAVTVVLADATLVIMLHGALTPAEQAMAQVPNGAAKVQEFHSALFSGSAAELSREIKRITGVEVREAAEQVETDSGTVVHAFTQGATVQMFLLASKVSPEVWTGVEEVKAP
jgi:uncharacterized protein YbcI